MMNLDTGSIESLLSRKDNLFDELNGLFAVPDDKELILVCHKEDEERAANILREKGIEAKVVFHETSRAIDGRAIVIVKESSTELEQDAIDAAVDSFREKLAERELRNHEQSLVEIEKRMSLMEPTVQELEQRSWQREQQKLAIRHSNKFGRRK